MWDHFLGIIVCLGGMREYTGGHDEAAADYFGRLCLSCAESGQRSAADLSQGRRLPGFQAGSGRGARRRGRRTMATPRTYRPPFEIRRVPRLHRAEAQPLHSPSQTRAKTKAKGEISMVSPNLMRVFWAITLCTIASVGCDCARREGQIPDTVGDELHRIKQSMKDPLAKERIASALSMQQNNIADSEPVLIVAGLVPRGKENGKAFLRMAIYDENEDVLGFTLHEEWNAADGRRESVSEEYPVFAHTQLSGTLCYPRVAVKLRNSEQLKDDERWRVYIEEGGSSEDLLQGAAHRSEIPPVYVSAPEPNEVVISLYVYDRAGHKSDPVRLVNRAN